MTLYGPDGSTYQKGIKLTQDDWDAVSFVIWRCASEGGAPDPTFGWARDQAKAHGKPFLAYTFLPSDPSRADEATAAAINDPTIPVMCDWEKSGCTTDEMLTWVHDLRGKGYRVPLLYTGRAFWQAAGSPRLSGYDFDLVVARYGGQKADGEYEIVPRYTAMDALYGAETWGWNLGGLHPVFWQYGSRIRWGDRFMDMNAFRGSHGDLAQWFKMPPAAAPAPGDVPPQQVEADHGVFVPPTVTQWPPTPPEDDDMARPVYIVTTVPDGQYYATDLVEVANKITTNVAAGGREYHGWIVGGDSGPLPLDAEWSDYVRDLDAKS